MSLVSKISKLLPHRASPEERAERKRAGAVARRQIQIEKADPQGVATTQNIHQRGNTSF